VTITQLENRTGRLFGREADLTRLLQRTGRPGLTAIVGPPQIGKSWLLMELAYRLDRETNPRCLVGFTRSPKGANDPLLQVVSDLYQRWLGDSTSWDQVKTVWEQQKDGLLPAFAKFVGKLSEKAAKLVPGLGELMGTAIRESLEGLVAASEDLDTGRVTVSRLEYTEAQELLSSVRGITKRRIALVMDQWEETGDLNLQRNAFRDFVREPEQWPDCHILLGARERSDAANLLHGLEAEYPGGACVYTLGEMDLTADTEQRRLVSFLRAQPQLRAIENIADQRVLKLIGGYPRVISRWTAEEVRDTVRSFEGLAQLAKDANEFRYRDLEKLLLDLDGDRRKLAARIALVPLIEDTDAWRALRPIILANLDPNALDDLKLADVLDKEAVAPRFGHPTRRDAARAFLNARRGEAVRAEAEGLILALARSITEFDKSTIDSGEALASLRDTAVQQDLGSLPLALCEAALRVLTRTPLPSPASLIEGTRQARRAPQPGLALVLAAGLHHTLIDATAQGDLAGRDALLDELRALARAYPDEAAVRGRLAWGLFITRNHANREGDLALRDALLDELRALARAYSDDAGARMRLAMGLANTRLNAKAEGDLARRDALLDELRALARAYTVGAAAGLPGSERTEIEKR
jgi:hypothetical protein